MNNIENYIDLLKSEKEKTESFAKRLKDISSDGRQQVYGEAICVFSFCIEQAELLLKSANESNHADVANTEKDEVSQESDLQSSASAGDGCSETRLERQNEQTKESCNHSCSPSDWCKGGKCDINGCYHE